MAGNSNVSQAATPEFNNPLLQRFFSSPAEKEDKENGKKIVRAFYNQQTSNDTNLNYFKGRNARWIELLLWAKGSQPMKEFLDYLNVSDGNKAWVNMDMTQQRIAAQFVGTLVESMAKNKMYACVNAIDDGSISEKEKRKNDALYRMHDQQTIAAMQQASGMQLEPPNAYIPSDEMSARVYFELEDRLPKEIRFEKMLNMIQDAIRFEKVINRKGLYDMVTLNFEATKIEKISEGNYTVRKCIPTNMVYNFFMNDTGECEVTMVGEFYNLKVKDFRSRFGKSASNPNGLDEKQIYDLAKASTDKNIGKFNYVWQTTWAYTTYNYNRPYDDCSILVFDCEINCGEDVYYVSKKDNYGKENISVKKGIPYQQKDKNGNIIIQEKPDDVEITKTQKSSWMRGVYAPYGDTMLYWGRPDIIVQKYTDTNKPLSSYTINIPYNDGEYMPSLFERIIEPLKEYSLAKLKRKQLIAALVPDGIMVDVESARNTDLGSGNIMAWEEVVRIYQQTGNVIWSSKGINPNERQAPPITDSPQRVTIQKIIELTNIIRSLEAEMRMLIGSSVYLEGGDVGERTAARLQEGQLDQAPNVFGYVLNAHNEVWEETFYKICLLHWNDIVRKEPESKDDLLNTRFQISIKMKSTDYEKQQLERDIDRYSQVQDASGNPALSPKDAMMLREIDNYKLACWYLATTVEENRKKSMQDSLALQAQNAKVQQDSMMASEQAKEASAKAQLALEMQAKEVENKEKKQQILLQVIGEIRSKGLDIPTSWQPIENELMQSLHMSLFMENKETEMAIDEGIASAAQQQNTQGQPQQMQPQVQSPQPQMQ